MPVLENIDSQMAGVGESDSVWEPGMIEGGATWKQKKSEELKPKK
jgi:hypothetical protein